MAGVKEEFRVANWVNMLIAIWLILAPFAMAFTELELAMWNSVAAGVLMLLVALFGVIKPLRKPALIWVNFIIGLWLVVSPFALGFSEFMTVTLSQLAMGILVAILAAGSAVGARRGEP